MIPVNHEQRVSRAALKSTVARCALNAAIRDAHANGMSLRAIAAAAEMSHERVRMLVSVTPKRPQKPSA